MFFSFTLQNMGKSRVYNDCEKKISQSGFVKYLFVLVSISGWKGG